MIYGQFADFYDELFDPAMYDSWLGFVRQQGIKQTDNMLDLACGTGRLAIQLRQAGFQVSGLDMAPEMLSIAAEKANAADVTLPLIQGDMTALGDLGNYDAMTCFDDSLCYLADENQLAEAFREVRAHLNAGGHYLFDVITPYQTDDVYPGYMYNFHDDHRAFMWTSYEGDAPHQVEHDLNFFIWNSSLKGYEHHSELHVERTYPLATYQRLLKDAGFKDVRVTADFGHAMPSAKTTRWFFNCQ
ncbi:MAG TPA: SAM-dependent methyltransferase [Lactobacillus sp.]|nr:SAM-dependent methyltransferase [Lactobacillus sp.]